jgi:hypothetical protein
VSYADIISGYFAICMRKNYPMHHVLLHLTKQGIRAREGSGEWHEYVFLIYRFTAKGFMVNPS